MSSSSFLGQKIEVILHTGGSVKGSIVSIDASSGSLSIKDLHSSSPVVVTRAEIADLKMLPMETETTKQQQYTAPQTSQFQDPAILSYSQKPTTAMEKMSLKPSTASSPLPVPKAPAAMRATHSNNGTASKPQAAIKTKGKKKIGVLGNDVGTSSRTQTVDETENEAASKKKMKPLKNKNKAHQQMGMSMGMNMSGGQSDLDEDFDFDKALKSFDKRKIWQEIKTTDHTDPKMLLVSHNRLNGSGAKVERGRFNGRNAQDKLGLHEPVLSPSPTGSHSSLSPVQDNVLEKTGLVGESLSQNVETNKLEAELQRVRGNALQREMENGKLKDDVCRLTERIRVLQALGGVELEIQTEDVDGHKWRGVIFDSLSAHAESKRSVLQPALGSLTFLLKSFKGEASKLRYLGVVQEKSDTQVLERLPPQYKKEMGLKAESASVFVRRIKEAIQAK